MEPELPTDANWPVTTAVTRRVKPGHEAGCEAFLAGTSGAARAFPGYLGVEIFHPAANGEYRIVYRFDSVAHLRCWLDSPEHAAWLARAEPHVAGRYRPRSSPGWRVVHPADPAGLKMAIVTWVTIFPLITLVMVASAPLLGRLPLVARLAVTTGVTVPLMIWVVMPRVTRLLHRWLYPDRRQ